MRTYVSICTSLCISHLAQLCNKSLQTQWVLLHTWVLQVRSSVSTARPHACVLNMGGGVSAGSWHRVEAPRLTRESLGWDEGKPWVARCSWPPLEAWIPHGAEPRAIHLLRQLSCSNCKGRAISSDPALEITKHQFYCPGLLRGSSSASPG